MKAIALGCRMHLSVFHRIKEGTAPNHRESALALYGPVKSNTNVLRPPTVYF